MCVFARVWVEALQCGPIVALICLSRIAPAHPGVTINMFSIIFHCNLDALDT